MRNTADQRPHVALIHGLGLDTTMWNRVTRLLPGRFDVDSHPLLGHAPGALVPQGLTLRDMAGFTASHLRPRTHLVGFSLGGLVAAHVARWHPTLVRSLTLVSTAGRRTEEERAAVRERFALMEGDFEAGIDDMLDRWFRPHWLKRDQDLVHDLAAAIRRHDREALLACFRLFTEADIEVWSGLPDIAAPTRVITGSEDLGSTPAMAADLAATIPSASSYVVDDSAHLLPLEQPEALATLLVDHVDDVESAAPNRPRRRLPCP
ncbi:alpha/beta fold hydrolase [Streptomyces iranensis]|uniref:Alpha/beta hydrolase fold containing protein n=1 Tax=Streptomyces iranensis TaxID=576784 RepID=A0A060ZZZ1_9ACTN|nr:alpha/beta hydrolase [Streptomyces iranensis]MBP2066159.1 pimeloyl-ACP methyl ester carboxylesterase [Streptomyces iranensis]CDR13177.1 alpha/beta hydrolase fold containing protein [Streptomyces iranensis]